jgi:methyl-accepting chemotaxis protein
MVDLPSNGVKRRHALSSTRKDAPMSEQNLISRIGSWFRRSHTGEEYLPEDRSSMISDNGGSTTTAIETRTSFLRPWARRDAAIQHLQEGFHTLTDLMSTVRSNLEQQNKRQEELLQYLSHLPQAIQSLPEANRVQTEALKAIHQQLTQQNSQQERLADILEKLNAKGLENREVLDEVRERVETMRQTDAAIAENLNGVGAAMQQLSRTEATSAQVLEQMRDNIDSRDGQLERVLHRQGTRFTTMLAIAIFLSISALVAVCVIGYLMLSKQ